MLGWQPNPTLHVEILWCGVWEVESTQHMLKYLPVHWRSTLFVWDTVSQMDTHLILFYMNMWIVSPFDPAQNANFCKGTWNSSNWSQPVLIFPRFYPAGRSLPYPVPSRICHPLFCVLWILSCLLQTLCIRQRTFLWSSFLFKSFCLFSSHSQMSLKGHLIGCTYVIWRPYYGRTTHNYFDKYGLGKATYELRIHQKSNDDTASLCMSSRTKSRRKTVINYPPYSEALLRHIGFDLQVMYEWLGEKTPCLERPGKETEGLMRGWGYALYGGKETPLRGACGGLSEVTGWLGPQRWWLLGWEPGIVVGRGAGLQAGSCV